VANIQIREADACRHTNEAKESFTTLAKKAHQDTMEFECIQKEQDELLQTVARLRAERDSAHLECADAHR
jgi:hypothetical protein